MDVHGNGVGRHLHVLAGGCRNRAQQFAVNLDTSESRLDRFDAELLPDAFQRETAADNQEIPRVEVAKPVPFFRYVLTAVLGLLLMRDVSRLVFRSCGSV